MLYLPKKDRKTFTVTFIFLYEIVITEPFGDGYLILVFLRN